jgi:hypothetical protein
MSLSLYPCRNIQYGDTFADGNVLFHPDILPTGQAKAGQSDGYVTVRVRRYNPTTRNYGDWEIVTENKHNLLTDPGRDFFHAQCYTNTAAGTIGSNYIVVSNNATAPAAGDTVVAGELSANGFSRAQATTRTHTAGTNSTTLAITFTATGTQTAIQKSGLLNASSTGTLTHEATFTSTDLVTNDQLSVTWTLNLG